MPPRMHVVLSLLAVLGALGVGVVSPGPSFLLVARTAVAGSRKDGLWVAVGMGVGGVLFAILAVAGLGAMIAAAPRLYLIFRIVGAVYLIYLGYRIWRGAMTPLEISSDDARTTRAFRRGLLTQLGNPKTAVVYGSVFAALLPPELPAWALVVLPVLVFALETGWYAVVAVLLSTAAPRAGYLRAKGIIDRLAGAVMALLGAKLLADALRE